jgi:PKD repeat protein
MKIIYLSFLLLLTQISSEAQTADFTFAYPGNINCAPQQVVFTASTAGNPSVYIWNFGDGTFGNAGVENHLFTVPGTYTVTLTSVYSRYASSISKNIVINPTPTVSLSSNRAEFCQPGAISFTASGSGPITSYEWNYGDGSPVQITGSNITSHNYTAFGSYNLTVKALTANGCSATDALTVRITKIPLSGAVDIREGCLPINATLAVSPIFLPTDGLQSIVWQFGDGTPSVTGMSSSIMHVYNTTNPITTATATVTSVQGCTNQFTFPAFAYGIPPTNAVAYTTPLKDTFCASENIRFYGYADSASKYEWSFGDGTIKTTTTTTISHRYFELDKMTVSMTPYYNGCKGTKIQFDIFIEGVVALYTYSNLCTNRAKYQFTNNSLGNISTYQWTFSDTPGLIDSVNYSPSHTFPPVANSEVKLYLYDSITQCEDEMVTDIYTALPFLRTDKLDVCKDSAITYTVINSYPLGVGFSYEFHINNTFINNGDSIVRTINPLNYGTFNDFVVIKDGISGTCNDTLRLAPVNVRGPLVSISFPPREIAEKLVDH